MIKHYALIVLFVIVSSNVFLLKAQPGNSGLMMEGEARNPFADEQYRSVNAHHSMDAKDLAEPEFQNIDLSDPEAVKQAAANRDSRVMDAAARKVFRRSFRQGGTKSKDKFTLMDVKTGAPLDVEDSLDEFSKNDTEIDSHWFSRENLAEMGGLTPEEAKQIWPWEDRLPDEPMRLSDLAKARKYLGEGDSMESALTRLLPGKGKERREKLAKTILTPTEVSFSCYAAIGFPFPIRVGRVGDRSSPPPPNGYVIFNPEMLRADVMRQDWIPRTVTYRWMEGKREVYSSQARVETYIHLARPAAPVSHLLLSSDDDVMAYQLVGEPAPSGIWDVRRTITTELVDLYSYLRPPTTLYGIRWGLLPGIEEIKDQPQTRERLGEILSELGFLKNKHIMPEFRVNPDDLEPEEGP